MEPSFLDRFRSLLGQPSRIAAGIRPDTSASPGELSERVTDRRNVDLVPINQLVSNVKGTADLQALKSPSFANAARFRLGIAADGAIG